MAIEKNKNTSHEGEIEVKQRGDKYVWAIYLFLCIVSLVELYSASSREVATYGVYGPIVRHAALLFVGFLLLLVMQRIHYKYLKFFTVVFAVLSVGLALYVLFFGAMINGARRALVVAGITLQPAEMIKLSVVLVIAMVMSSQKCVKDVSNKAIAWMSVYILVCCGLLFSQGLTNTILVLTISFTALLATGIPLKKFGIILLCFGVLGSGAMLFKLQSGDKKEKDKTENVVSGNKERDHSGTWSARIERFFNDSIPKYEQKLTADNRQEMYSYMAQANGGIFGVMPGNSRESARLPLAFSDYIFAIIVEDLGLFGGTIVMGAFLMLLLRAGSIARRCKKDYPAMLVIGVASMIVIQALIHVAIVTGAGPVSGQPLPLISKGGTSILITSLAFGIILGVSRYAVKRKPKKALASSENEQNI